MPVLSTTPLGFVWPTVDPFLFCVHHADAYPAGDERLGPAASLAGRALGNDFELRDGWRMYHGRVVPGFPQHPHRGFETVTIVRRGFVDHADSLGAAARYGEGDVQWLTAGAGIVHSEMFPLLRRDAPNPLELFQIWLNLAPEDKMAPPRFTMLWGTDLPRIEAPGLEVVQVTGAPPRSWAARPDSDVAIWTIRLDGSWEIPPCRPGTVRTLYVFDGTVRVGDSPVGPRAAARVRPDVPIALEGRGEILMLQGRPIGRPVVAHGPFVMNTPAEIQAAFADYRRTGFGGWPWSEDGPVHARDAGRFATPPAP